MPSMIDLVLLCTDRKLRFPNLPEYWKNVTRFLYINSCCANPFDLRILRGDPVATILKTLWYYAESDQRYRSMFIKVAEKRR